MPHIVNTTSVLIDLHKAMLSVFPAEYRTKLQVYTAEELFYVSKLLSYVPADSVEKHNGDKPFTGKDLFLLSLKGTMVRFLQGKAPRGIAPAAFQKVAGSSWKEEFLLYIGCIPEGAVALEDVA